MTPSSSPKKRPRRFKRGTKPDSPTRSANHRFAFILIIGLAIAAAIAIPLLAPAQDRIATAIFELMIIGLGFVVYGATMAVEKELQAADDRLHWKPKHGLYRRRLVPRGILQMVYLSGLVLGVLRAFVQPQRSWPAVLWVLGGMCLGATGIALLMLFD